jgi:hypothetical protein
MIMFGSKHLALIANCQLDTSQDINLGLLADGPNRFSAILAANY